MAEHLQLVEDIKLFNRKEKLFNLRHLNQLKKFWNEIKSGKNSQKRLDYERMSEQYLKMQDLFGQVHNDCKVRLNKITEKIKAEKMRRLKFNNDMKKYNVDLNSLKFSWIWDETSTQKKSIDNETDLANHDLYQPSTSSNGPTIELITCKSNDCKKTIPIKDRNNKMKRSLYCNEKCIKNHVKEMAEDYLNKLGKQQPSMLKYYVHNARTNDKCELFLQSNVIKFIKANPAFEIYKIKGLTKKNSSTKKSTTIDNNNNHKSSAEKKHIASSSTSSSSGSSKLLKDNSGSKILPSIKSSSNDRDMIVTEEKRAKFVTILSKILR